MQNKHVTSSIKTRGSALIVALLITTLVATAATMMTLQQQTQIARTSLILNNDRMYFYEKAVEGWAIGTLTKNLATAKQQVMNRGGNIKESVIDVLPATFSEITVNNTYHISGRLDDAQGRFNLNNLTKSKYERQFANLIMAVYPDIEIDEAKAIAKATHDWVTRPSVAVGAVAAVTNPATPVNSPINRYYTSRNPSYRAAQALMASASELRLVKGVTPALYVRLQPFVIALPKVTPININTALAPVLASLGSGINLQEAMQMVQSRANSPFNKLSQFFNSEAIQKANIAPNEITLNSNYFLVFAKTSTPSEKSSLTALLYRPIEKEKDEDSDKAEAKSDNTEEEETENKLATINMQDENLDQKVTATILWESRGGI